MEERREASSRLGEPVSKEYVDEQLPDGARGRKSTLFARVGRLSDGVFAIALTLLVLNFEVPDDADDLLSALVDLVPTAIAFTVTVFVVALFWRNHHHLFHSFRGIDGSLVGLNFVYLALVALVPFPNELVGTFPGDPWSYVAFATLLAALATVDTAMFVYATRRNLLRDSLRSGQFRLEVIRGGMTVCLFVVSIPLSFVLVEWTPILYLGLLLVDLALVETSGYQPQ